MPLLKGRLYPPVKPLSRKNISPSETVYIITHTDEQFLSKVEYEKRLALYEEPVWTCQCTGAIKLTHREALESERKVLLQLKGEFPSVFEKAVLEIVHHNTIALEQLIDEAYRRLHESLVVGESVILKVSTVGKPIRGTVLKVDSVHAEKKSAKSESAEEGENVKRTPPKLLPHTYSIKMEGEEKAINGIPATDLQRMTKVPKKDLLKLFIRAHAVRASTHPNSPWVVSAELVQKHSLMNKFSSFLITGAKANGKENSESHPQKRKRSVSSSDQKPAKKQKKESAEDKKKLDSSNNKQTQLKSDSAKKVQPTTAKSPSTSTAKKSLWPAKTESKASTKSPREASDKKSVDNNVNGNTSGVQDISDDEEVILAVMKASNQQNQNNDSGPKKGKEDKKSGSEDASSPKKKKKDRDSEGSKNKSSGKPKASNGKSSPKKVAQVKLYRLAEPKSPDKKMKQVTLYQLVNKKSDNKTSTNTPSKQKKNDDDSPKYSLVKKTPSKASSPKEDDESVKYSLAKKTPSKSPSGANKNQKTPVKSEGVSKELSLSGEQKKPTTSRKPPQPVVVVRLQKAKKEGNKMQIAQLISRCAKELSEKQIKALPADLIDEVTRKFEIIQEKRKIEKMSPEEKEAYLQKKKEEMRLRAKENMKKKWAESKKRFEDTELELKALPLPKIITTPDGIPNELFGDVVMITEFIYCYKKLLMPDDKETFTAEQLMTALVSGKEGFSYIARIICVLLQTLLQDQLAEDYKELMIPLSQLPVNEYTCTELLRLCLRKKDTLVDDESSSQISDSTEASAVEDIEIPEGLIEQLESCEYHELDVEAKIRILVGLCHRVMGTYSLQEYMEEKQQDAAELWKKKIAEQKEQNDKKKLDKHNKKDKPEKSDSKQENVEKTNQPASDNATKGSLTINSFYDTSSKSEATAAADEDDDMISVLKSRRQNAARLAEERRLKDEERRLHKEKEQQEFKNQKEKESAEKQFKTGILLAKNVFRLSPLGTDRHHNRYWVFRSAPGRIYVEKGWAPQEIDYCTQSGSGSADVSDSESSDEESDDASQSGAQEKLSKSVVEKTFPHKGQNLWFSLDSVTDFEMLLEGLHPLGARESVLKTHLMKEKDHIMKILGAVAKGESGKGGEILEDIDFIEGFRTELLDTEMRLSRGGLGGVPNLDLWEGRLKKANSIPEFAKLLIETKKHTLEKFLHGILSESHRIKTKGSHDSQEDSANNESEEEVKVSNKFNGMELWLEALNHCTTYSRLHVLLGILDSCINWEKSVENVKCRICRKKGVEDDHLLLCDECNQPYHLFCLRPALFEIPIGEWFCASCMPEKLGRRSRAPRVLYGQQSDEENEDSSSRRRKHQEAEVEEDEGIADIKHDTECIMCGGDDNLIPCTTCSSVFHIDCHDPPLRRSPRPNTWKCMQCRTGQRIIKKMSSSKAKALSKKRKIRYQENDDDNDDEDYSPSNNGKMLQKKWREANKRKRVNCVVDSSEETDSDSEADSPQSRKKKQKQQKVLNDKQKFSCDGQKNSDDKQKTSKKGIPGSSKGEKKEEGVDKVIVLDIINRLMKHRSSWPFLEPVDPEEVTDYYTLIKNPMDLQTMRDKCLSDLYTSPQQVIDDFTLLIKNAEQYNQEDSAVSKCIQPLEKYFDSFVNRYFPQYKYSAIRST